MAARRPETVESWEMSSGRRVATRVDAQVRSQPLSATGFFGNPLFRSVPIRSTVPRLDSDEAANSRATRVSLPQSRLTLKPATYRNITLAVSARSISIICAIRVGSPGVTLDTSFRMLLSAAPFATV